MKVRVGKAMGFRAILTICVMVSMLLLPGGVPAVMADVGFPISESFKGNTAPGWTLGGNAHLTGGGDGWLRLTNNATSQRGYAYYDQAFPSDRGIVVSFDFATWGGNGADGTTFFLFDGSTPTFSPGQFGGSLGYSGVPGLSGGYVGIGLDEYGNFSVPWPGQDGGPGFRPGAVVVRGPASTNYRYIAGVTSPQTFHFPHRSNRPSQTGSEYRKAVITITPDKKITVQIQFGAGAALTKIVDNAALPVAPPPTLKLGFAASTGALQNFHEIRNVTVAMPTDLSVILSDGGLTNVHPGEAVTYTATVTNHGPNDVTGATVAGSFSAALENVTWACSASVGSACGEASGTGNSIGTTVSLKAGGTATFTISGVVAASPTVSVMGSFEATAPAEITDTDPANNKATDKNNLPPQFTGGLSQTITEEEGLSPVTAADADGDGVTFSLAGALPSGISFNSNGTFSGTATMLSAGTYTVQVTASDGMSATTQPMTIVVRPLDTQPPVTTSDAAAGWVNHDVTVTLTATDDRSGVKATYWRLDGGGTQTGTSVAVAGEAVHNLEFWSEDNAGNVESVKSAQVKIDKTAPSISGSRTPAPNAAGWSKEPVTVTFDCADALSGVASCPAAVTVATEGAGQQVSGTAADNAGNSASATVADINIDMTPPTIECTGNAGTYGVMDMVNIPCPVTDPLSGLASHDAESIIGPAWSFGAGEHTYTFTATDRAGNVTTTTVTFTVMVTYADLCTLSRQFADKEGIGNSLCAKLDAAKRAAERGNDQARAGAMGAYLEEVKAQSGKALTAEEAAILTRLAGAIQ